MPVTTGIITAGLGLGTTIYGAIQKQKAQKAANANVMPTYQIPQSQNDVLNLAESQAANGMSAAARQQLQNNANSGLAATLNSQQRNGGDANAMAGAYNNYAEGIDKNAIYDDQARVANLRNLQTQYQNQSAYQDKAWQINDYAPWANKAQAIAGQLQGANQWETSGFNMLGGAIGKLGSALTPQTNPSMQQTPAIGGADGSVAALNTGYSNTPFRFDQNPAAGSGNGGFQWNGYYPVSAP